MPEAISRVLSRIQQIRDLLGETSRTNEGFGKELDRSTDGSGAASRAERPARRLQTGTRISTLPAEAGSWQAPNTLAPIIEEAAEKSRLPEQLISAVMSVESGFNPDAVSSTGALGLMQLMPGTARGLGVDDPSDPRQNVLGGAAYLRQQLDRFGDVEKALAAYNAGPKAVEQFGGVPPFHETQSYVRRVMERLRRFTNRRE